MDTSTFNTNEYFIKDVAYELNSHPDYIIQTNIINPKPTIYNDFNTSFINILNAPKNIQNFLQFIDKLKTDFKDQFSLNMNEIINIFFYINNTSDMEKSIIIIGLSEDFSESDYTFINIFEKIERFKNNYKYDYEKKDTFRKLQPVKLEGPYITLKTFKISLKNYDNLNDIFDNIIVSEKFPFTSYYSYLKIHSQYDNNSLSNISSYIQSQNNSDITIYYLFNTKKPNDINSYIPITIKQQYDKFNIITTFNESMWNSIKSDFYKSFVNVKFGSEKIISQEGSFFIFGDNINYSILSYICLNMSNDFIIKNERSSTRGSYKLIYNLENIVVGIKNNNITGSIEEKKISILTNQPLNTKYIDISFKSKNNNLNNADIECIQKYTGQLLKMYSIHKYDIITLFKSISIDFIEDEDISNKDIVKTKDIKSVVEFMKGYTPKDFKYTRVCQKGKQTILTNEPPILLDIDSIDSKFKNSLKKDINGVHYLNWPTDTEYWFHCNNKDNKKEFIYPFPSNENNYYTPCCFKELDRNLKKLTNYLESTGKQVIKQIKINKNTILLNLGYIGINITDDQLDNSQILSKFFKSEISQLKKKKNINILNIDKQSNLQDINYNKLENISLSLEYILQTNIVIFDELGSILLPPSTNYIGNIYYHNIYKNTRFFIRQNNNYIELFPEISSNHLDTLLNNKKLFRIINTVNTFELPTISMIESQYLDSYGKCRIIKFIDNKVYCQTFLPPLPIQINNQLYHKELLIEYSDINDIINIPNMSIIGQFILDNVCLEVRCKYYNFIVYCNINNIKPLIDIDTYDDKKIIYGNGNYFQQYSNIRKQSEKLKTHIVNQPTISNEKLIDIVNKLNIDVTETQLVMNKLVFFRQLYTSKKSISKSYIEPTSNILDYTSYPKQRIVNTSHTIIPKEYSLKLTTNFNNSTLILQPYFILFNNNIYLTQDCTSIQNCCYLHTYWNQFNTNYNLTKKYMKCNDYIIYDVDSNELLKLGNGNNKIIVVNPNQTDQKFMTLLPL
jgi:hypothetical protein